MTKIAESELLITDSGAVYHLGLRPEHISDKIIVVGDPDRVSQISKHFDSVECDISHREFHTATGLYRGKRVTAMSTGISSDNVDILMTELDALVNIDFNSREVKSELRSLDIVRLGTCGAIQEEFDFGDFILSHYSIGLDGMVNFYADSHKYRIGEAEQSFMFHTEWDMELPRPYMVESSCELEAKFDSFTKKGFTACAGGFFGPQGRVVRLSPTINNLVGKASDFEYNGYKITNFEMEGAAVIAMAKLLGHRATAICVVLAHRTKRGANMDYATKMDELIIRTLDVI